MLNKVILQGNIGRSPKVYTTQEGKEVVSFSLATSASWKDEEGEWQTSTDWHRITVFRPSTQKWIKDVLRRGDSVYVEGKLTYHPWTDKYGQSRSTPHIVVSHFDGKVQHLKSSSSQSEGSLMSQRDQSSKENRNIYPFPNLPKGNDQETSPDENGTNTTAP